MEFTDKESALAYLESHLNELLDDMACATDLSNALIDEFQVEPTLNDLLQSSGNSRGSSNSMSLVMPKKRWAILNDDLEAASLVLAVVPLVSTLFLDPTVATITIVANMINFTRNIHKKGVRLTEQQCLVLMEIKSYGDPITSNSLAFMLKQSEDDVLNTLGELSKIQCKNKNRIELVQQDTETGKWTTTNV